MASPPPQHQQGKERQQHHHPPRPLPKAAGMATTTRTGGDLKDRRGISPTAPLHSAKQATRPSPAAPSPEKNPAPPQKGTPSYLRATASSRIDQAASASSKPAKTLAAAAPVPKKFTRTRSMERPPPAAQPSYTIKNRTLARNAITKSAKPAVAVSHPPAGARPNPIPPKKKEPAASESLHDQSLDFLETMSEPELLTSAANLAPEDNEHPQSGGDFGMEEHPPPPSLSAEKPLVLVEDANEKLEQNEGEQPKHREQQRTTRDHLLSRPKSFFNALIPISSRVGAIDDELQRKLRARQAWEVEKEARPVAEDNIRRKENNGNDVRMGKSTAEKRRNKVLALVGAFENVISLKEPQPMEMLPAQARAETARSPTAPSALEREGRKQEDAAPVTHCIKEDDAVEEEEKGAEDVVAEEKRAEDVVVAEEKRPEDVVVAEEKGAEDVVLAEEKGAEDVVVAAEKRAEDVVVAAEKEAEVAAIAEEKMAEEQQTEAEEKAGEHE